MKKEDLKTGDILVTRDEMYVLYNEEGTDFYGYNHNELLTEALYNSGEDGRCGDVMKVLRGDEYGVISFGISDLFHTIWERPEPIPEPTKMTLK